METPAPRTGDDPGVDFTHRKADKVRRFEHEGRPITYTWGALKNGKYPASNSCAKVTGTI
jgi:hypothetical protein